MNRNAISVALTIALASLAGCQEPPDAPGEPVFTRTLVRVDDQGNVTYEQREISLSQQQRDKRLRELAERGVAASIVVDNSCAGASMWMFDQPGLTGNELCVFMFPKSSNWSNSGLWLYPRGPFGSLGTWLHAVRSLWAGAEAWRFSPVCGPGPDPGRNCDCEGAPFARQDPASGCVANASIVWLRCPTCAP
jgi:hypothetical protein